jgi:hypothetical protein
MTKDRLEAYAKAEAYLNETLAYQAASAVHCLREKYGLEIQQLQLVVAPDDPGHPGVVHVTCTVHSAREQIPLQIVVAIDPRNDGMPEAPGPAIDGD